MRTVRFSVPGRTCGKASFLRKTSSPAMSFVSFLQEKKSSPLLFSRKNGQLAREAQPLRRTSSFLFRRKTGRLAREAQPLRRTDAGTSCVVVGRNTTAGMPPSSALSLPVSAAPAHRLSRASRPRKRKSSAEKLLFCTVAFSANVPCKTDGSHTNRPFFRALCRTSGKPPFLRKTSSPAVSFVSFLQEKKTFPFRRKEIVPPL